MSELLPRAAWNARPGRTGPGPLNPRLVEGVALHWPGSSSSRPLSKAAVPRALRSWQNYHMDSPNTGWSDIAYQVAVDQWGRRWHLRGLETQSAANGNEYLNERYCAVLLVLVVGELPTAELLAGVQQTIREARQLYPNADRIVGHGEIRPGGTTCPGPITQGFIDTGRFEPGRETDDMPTPAEFWAHELNVIGADENKPARALLSETHHRTQIARELAWRAHRQANRNAAALEELARELAPNVAARVVELLGDRIDLELTVDGELDGT